MNAHMSKAEGDITTINTELAKVQPFAKTPIPSCADGGAMLRWTGGDWNCDEETDPTVQPFAKKAVPTCGAGQILSASGSDFSCTSSGFLSAEADTTVRTFAKSPLPSCGSGEVRRWARAAISAAHRTSAASPRKPTLQAQSSSITARTRWRDARTPGLRRRP
jgi:hypothetical protein